MVNFLVDFKDLILSELFKKISQLIHYLGLIGAREIASSLALLYALRVSQ